MEVSRFRYPGDRNLIGNRVKEARLSENPPATQKDILARLENEGFIFDETVISKIEKGTRGVNTIELFALAKVLKKTPNWLLDFDSLRQLYVADEK